MSHSLGHSRAELACVTHETSLNFKSILPSTMTDPNHLATVMVLLSSEGARSLVRASTAIVPALMAAP
jgi:hypothetical protein